ncbi:iron complex transport system substrate-binding protein [Arthrobacter sp. ov407]|nr:iron complex transport system substrate-binding protein [Arthrobacter sp. ov407]
MAMTPPNGPTTGRAIGRRGFLAAIVALPLALSACSATKGGDAVDVSANAFPLSLTNSYGTTTVEAPPKRVVALSSADADASAALGLAPVGISGSASSPWFTDAMRDIDGAPPFLLNDKVAMPLDDIRNLDPDVILAVGGTITRADYDKLSEIAPVVLSESTDSGREWRQRSALIGKVLGRSDAAAELQAKTEGAVRDSVRDYAGLKGTTILFAAASSVDGADIQVYPEDSVVLGALKDFGLVPAPAMAKVKKEGRATGGQKSPVSYVWPHERADELSADILVASVSQDDMADLRVGGKIPALSTAKQPSLFYAAGIEDQALRSGSALGVAWAGRNIVPELAKAAYYEGQRSAGK